MEVCSAPIGVEELGHCMLEDNKYLALGATRVCNYMRDRRFSFYSELTRSSRGYRFESKVIVLNDKRAISAVTELLSDQSV